MILCRNDHFIHFTINLLDNTLTSYLYKTWSCDKKKTKIKQHAIKRRNIVICSHGSETDDHRNSERIELKVIPSIITQMYSGVRYPGRAPCPFGPKLLPAPNLNSGTGTLCRKLDIKGVKLRKNKCNTIWKVRKGTEDKLWKETYWHGKYDRKRETVYQKLIFRLCYTFWPYY